MVICRPSGCPHTRWLPPSWRYSDHPRFRRNASTSLSFAIGTRRRPREELGLSVEEEEEGDRAQANNEAPRSKLRGITELNSEDFSEGEANPVASYGECQVQGDFVSPGTAGGESFPLCRPWQ